LRAEEGVETEGEEGATGVHGYGCLAHRTFASLRAGGAEGVYGVVAVVVAGGCTAGWDAVVAAVVGNTAVLAVGVVDHTDSEQQELAALELARVGEHMAAQILQRPGADKECMVGLQGAAVAVAVVETAPAVRVAVAVAAAAAVVVVAAAAAAAAAAAIGSFVSHHNHNLRTKQIAPAEGAVVRGRAVGPGQLATVGCTLAALEADLLLQLL
jgi:hypothetical protein